MTDSDLLRWQSEFGHWVARLADTHDSVRFTVGHRLRDWRRADTVAVRVVIEMLHRPKVFRYQGLPYAGRIATLAERFIASQQRDEDIPEWSVLVDYLDRMPPHLRAVHVAAYVHGLDDGTIASAAQVSAGTVAGWRTDVETYLFPPSFDHHNGKGYEIPERICNGFS